MSLITLVEIRARQSELDSMIKQFGQQSNTRTIDVAATTIELQPGEHYAGATLDDEGLHKHDIVLLAARPAGRLSWRDAMAWAESVGGTLPDRQEQALIFANCKPHLKPEWHWSSEEHADASYAWYCSFGYGDQLYDHKSYAGCAVAVRRA